MNTALGTKKAGMVLLNTTSFSAVASQAIPTIFSATYDFYKIVLDLTANSVDNTTSIKLRSGSTDSSTSYYYGYAGQYESSTVRTEYGSNVSGGWWAGTMDFGNTGHYVTANFDLYRPFLAVPTTFTYTSTSMNYTGSVSGNAGGGQHRVSTSYDGFNIVADTGTITGKVQVYGYNQ
jgi:hypothetical protein